MTQGRLGMTRRKQELNLSTNAKWRKLQLMFKPLTPGGWQISVPGREGFLRATSVRRALIAAEDLWR